MSSLSSFPQYFDTLKSSFPLDKTAQNRLVLNFLIHEGYQETVVKFAKEVGIKLYESENAELVMGLNSMEVRGKIKHKLLKGEISDAIEDLNTLYPDLLEKNNFLYFKLLLLSLIEMIRNYTQNKNGGKVSNDNKEEFIMTVIKFAQDKLTNKAVKNVKFMEELELTMTLLIYSNHKEMLPPRLNELFEVKLRRDIADLVNKFILLEEMENMIEINYKAKFTTSDYQVDHKDNTHADQDGSNGNSNGINDSSSSSSSDDIMLSIHSVDSKLKKLIKLWVWLENKVHLSYGLDVPLFKLDEDNVTSDPMSTDHE